MFELPHQGYVSKNIVYKAVQEAIFPTWFNKSWANLLFEKGQEETTFMNFLGLFRSARLFASMTETRLIDFEQWK